MSTSKKRKMLADESKLKRIQEKLRGAEVQFHVQQKTRVKCANPECGGNLVSCGVGGNPNSGGLRMLQFKCTKCGVKKRMATLLKELNEPELLKTYEDMVYEHNFEAIELLTKPRRESTLMDFWGNTQESSEAVGETARTASDEIECTPIDTRADLQTGGKNAVEGPEASTLPGLAVNGNATRSNSHANENDAEYWKKKYMENEKMLKDNEKKLNDLMAQMEEMKQNIAKLSGNVPASEETEGIKKTNAPKKDVLSATPAENNSYAAMVKKPAANRKNHFQKEAKKFTKVAGPPLEFAKIYYKVNDSRPLKKCKTAKEVKQLLNAHKKSIGINSEVFMISKIGNSVIEIIVPKNRKYYVRSILEENNLMILDDFCVANNSQYANNNSNYRQKMVKRITFQLKIARLQNLKKAIRNGIPADILSEVDASLESLDGTVAAATPMDLENCQ